MIPTGANAGNLVSSMFNIHEDLSPFYRAMENDSIMASLISQLRGVKNPTTPTVFEALVDSIIEQQISLKAAHSIENRLISAVGSPLVLERHRVYFGYPTPRTLAETPDSTFRACGLTRRKGEYIRGISQQILRSIGSGALQGLPGHRENHQRASPGSGVSGRWTAELTILRGLHRPDAFPAR